MDSPGMKELLLEHWHLALHLRQMSIRFYPERCVGVWECYEVCPVNCWKPDEESGRVIFQHADLCIACGACVLQCPEGAIELR
jgi:NAD-dependent dihydropyrimidine dehydrogenase PreA subunit